MSSIATIFLHRSTQRSKADYSVSDGQTVRADPQCGLLHSPKTHHFSFTIHNTWLPLFEV